MGRRFWAHLIQYWAMHTPPFPYLMTQFVQMYAIYYENFRHFLPVTNLRTNHLTPSSTTLKQLVHLYLLVLGDLRLISIMLQKKEFEELVRLGICRPSKSPWASPLLLRPKSNGGICLCGDYRSLNAITVPDRYPVPHIRDAAIQLSGAAVFSVVDLVKAFHNIPMWEEDLLKTAIITPFSLFEYVRMNFGLKNAGQTFMRFIHQVLIDLPFVFTHFFEKLRPTYWALGYCFPSVLWKFLNILMEILWHFLVNFLKNLWKIIGKIWKTLYGFCFLQECSHYSWLC